MRIVIDLPPVRIMDETTPQSMGYISVEALLQGLLDRGATPAGVLIAGVDVLWNQTTYARVYRWPHGGSDNDLVRETEWGPVDAAVLAAGYTPRDIYLAGIRALLPGCEQRQPEPKMWCNSGCTMEDAQGLRVPICDHCARRHQEQRRCAALH